MNTINEEKEYIFYCDREGNRTKSKQHWVYSKIFFVRTMNN